MKNCIRKYLIVSFVASNNHCIFLFEVQQLVANRALIWKFDLKVWRLMEGGS